MRRSPAPGLLGVFACLMVLAAGAPRLGADGFIIPDPRPGETVPPLTVKYHHVTVEIVNQVVRTSVDQVFLNNFDRDVEGTYIFPIPENAAVSEFAMYIGNERIKGEILDSREARRVYEEIVRRMRDPGLLEYIGRDMFQARVFPIPARGEKRVQISYTEVLKSDNNLVRYLYPLNTEKFSRDPLGDVSVSVRIESPLPILNIYSPSHRVSVRREGERRATVGYEESNVRPDRDFVVYYSLSPDGVGLSFMNWSAPEGGFFMLLASPRYAGEKDRILNKDVVLVLDSSGSMSGAKIRQVKAAAGTIVRKLGPGDRFSVVDFDDAVSLSSEELVAPTAENVARAVGFIAKMEEAGGTDVNEALVRALRLMRPGERPSYVLFLTDGLPSVGVVEVPEILRNVAQANAARARIFVFGVGDEVNTELLDRLAADSRGASVYVAENEDIAGAVSGFYDKVSSPLLSDLAVRFQGIETDSVYPRVLPDLSKGSEIVLVGRYKGAGPVTVVLTGKVGREERRFVLEKVRLAEDKSFAFLPRLWATRRVGYLLEEIRLHERNPELIDEIKRLGLRYGIVTPYTSFLVTEKGPLERIRSFGLPRDHFPLSAPPDAEEAISARRVSGAGAVKAARMTQALKTEDTAAESPLPEILYREDKTFHFQDDQWVDSEYRKDMAVRKIRFNSDEYFRLLAVKPEMAKYLSAGRRMIVVYQGIAYKIVD
jgi:Ca-activated chloride channel family protein